MIYIQRKETFCAAHKLWNEKWDHDTNVEIFGKCSNPNYHGHNFELIVTVKGEIDPDTGFVMNLFDLKKIIKLHITDKIDHKNLNLDVDFMAGKLTSSENLAVAIWDILNPLIAHRGAILHSVKLAETNNNIIEYFG
jgi:6-pyruvoyltetrahydropterin/6-carboxytetrahydropterin synthase